MGGLQEIRQINLRWSFERNLKNQIHSQIKCRCRTYCGASIVK